MNVSRTSMMLGAIALGGVTLTTKYTTERTLRTEVTTTLAMETVAMDVTRDGEPMQHPDMTMTSDVKLHEVHVDHIGAVEKDRPSKVKRAFVEVGGKVTVVFGDNSHEIELESPLADAALDISRDSAGKIDVAVVEGKRPADDAALKNHRPEHFLDALLPEGEVEKGAHWDLESDAIKRALRFDVDGGMYVPVETDEGSDGGGGPGGRRGGRHMMSGGDLHMMRDAEWKGKAKLVSTDEEVGGIHCAIIELELTASGEFVPPERDEGGPRRRAFMPETLQPFANTYDIKLTGRFSFATKDRRPVALDLEGSAKTESSNERKRDGSTMKFHTEREGKLTLQVKVSDESK